MTTYSLSMETQAHEGIFKPPVIAISHPPLPIAGPGRVTLTRDGLTLVGFQPSSQSGRVLLFFVAMAAIVFGLMAAGVQRIYVYGAGGGLGITLYRVLLAGTGKHRGAAPVQFHIPWASMTSAHPGPGPDEILLVVQHQSKKRAVHFFPAGGTAALIAAVSSRA